MPNKPATNTPITNTPITNNQLTSASKIFVAGGTGLVGSAIIKNLLKKGYTNIITTYHTRPPITNTPITNNQYTNNQYTNTPITWIKLDLLNTIEVEKFFKTQKPEFVFLAAAKVGGIVANNTYRAEFIYENLQIQNNVIHQSYLNGVKKLLFLGSTCIYPKNCPQPMKEEYLLTDELEYTNEPYAIAKIAGIKMCESYNFQYGTNFISVMPTNLYGENDNFDLEKSHVLPALIRKIHLGKMLEEENWDAIRKDLKGTKVVIGGLSLVIGEKSSEEELIKVLDHYGIKILNNQLPITNNPQISIEIWGSGKPRREFLWSDDMADACVFLMENRDFKDIISPITNTHINIGTGVDISIKELAIMIKDIVGYQGKLYFNTDKPDGTMVKLTDVTKLHDLGWKHKIELMEGIKRIHGWYLSND